MDTEGLDIVLTFLSQEYDELVKEAKIEVGKARTTNNHLDDLEERTKSVKEQLPSSSSSQTVHKHPYPSAQVSKPIVSIRNWESIREAAEMQLCSRGIDPTAVSLDNLLDPEEVKRLERRFLGGFKIETHLDKYDVATTVAAGLTGALVDFLIINIPKDIQYLGHIPQEGSPLTKWLHSLSVPHDNWLASYFSVAYDKVQEDISGMGPSTHRLQTFGHDPLIGLVIGTIDIMRGGLTAISKEGNIVLRSGTGMAHYNPFTAIVWQIMHLFSDGFTKMGLPPPGWSLVQLFQIGSFGDRERTVAEISRWMYLKGYDSRHFLTMSTSVAAIEVVLRNYFWIRRKLDEKYNADVTHEGEVVGTKRTGGHPRFQSMALAAHGIATAANAGKVAIYAGNPLAINYVQWLRFLQVMVLWMNTRMQSPSNVVKGHARANWKELEQGWPTIDVEDPAFPTLVVP